MRSNDVANRRDAPAAAHATNSTAAASTVVVSVFHQEADIINANWIWIEKAGWLTWQIKTSARTDLVRVGRPPIVSIAVSIVRMRKMHE